VDPVHNLIEFSGVAVIALVLLVWGIRALLRRRRLAREVT
jgi:hypothetical protein